MRYTPLFPYFTNVKTAFRILYDDYVTEENGAGVVHQASFSGEDDIRICIANDTINKDTGSVIYPIDTQCRFIDEVKVVNISCREISTIIGISKSSVQRALKRYEETGEFQDRPCAGRPKKLNERNIREIAIKLNWCLDYSNWTINQWKNIIFCDEICFYVIKRKNKTKIWRTKDERWKESCMHVAAAGGGGRVNFYGTITSDGTGCFRIYNENTNSDVYCDILDNYLIPIVQLYQMENNYFYQHDNSKYHLSKQTQMKFHELGVKVLKWPSKSPDLNPSESLWTVIDNKLKSKSLSSVKELIEALSKAWLSITPQLCQKLVFSMPR
ncbi:unnamed protein product [Rotaria sordida]|uniref:Tc1-like transposase DDE domain-containing protein n=1 Tax=Rotaria sordida TaxID=392033 RepID=A0A819SA75_9BILA|nr:unnamed protein product [Rotaria sordida]